MADDKELHVLIVSPRKPLFEGTVHRLILPGENGVFEIQPYHKRLVSRLIAGYLQVDRQTLKIRRGVVKVALNQVTVIVEEDA